MFTLSKVRKFTPHKFNIALEKEAFYEESGLPISIFQGVFGTFHGCIPIWHWAYDFTQLVQPLANLETNIFAPENGWLEYDRFLLGPRPIFRGFCC